MNLSEMKLYDENIIDENMYFAEHLTKKNKDLIDERVMLLLTIELKKAMDLHLKK